MTSKIIEFIVLDENQDPALNESGLPQLLQRPDTKTEQDIERLISLGKPMAVINVFAELTSLGEQWNWAQSYFDYLVELNEVNEYNANLPEPIANDDGTTTEAEPKPLPPEPVRPALRSADEVLEPYRRTIFKIRRQEEVDSLIVEVDRMVFDADEISQGRMARAVVTMEDSDTISWVLANNDHVKVTKVTLLEALRLAGLKQTAIWVDTGKT